MVCCVGLNGRQMICAHRAASTLSTLNLLLVPASSTSRFVTYLVQRHLEIFRVSQSELHGLGPTKGGGKVAVEVNGSLPPPRPINWPRQFAYQYDTHVSRPGMRCAVRVIIESEASILQNSEVHWKFMHALSI